eukprot:COSAG01_NODE_6113_length_3843_cov_5.851763_4_plen_79_part_00
MKGVYLRAVATCTVAGVVRNTLRMKGLLTNYTGAQISLMDESVGKWIVNKVRSTIRLRASGACGYSLSNATALGYRSG